MNKFYKIIILLSFCRQASAQVVYNSGDSTTLKNLHRIGDSIMIANVGLRTFQLFYAFSEEESLIDSLDYTTPWNRSGIQKGTSFELNYQFKSDFNNNGTMVYLWRNGKQKFPVTYGVIPGSINGKAPKLISRKEAFSIARKFGMKDTFALEYFMKIDTVRRKCVYRLQIQFRVPAKRADDEKKHDSYYGVKTIIVNPWTKKVIRCRHEDFLLQKPQVSIKENK